MKKTVLMLSGLVPVAVFLIWQLLPPESAGPSTGRYAGLAQTFREKGAIENGFDGFLTEVFRRAVGEEGGATPVNINGPYDERAINVYVVRPAVLRTSDVSAEVRDLADVLKNNFVSFPPNLITIDSHFLAALMVNAYNDTLGLAQSFAEVQNAPATDAEIVANGRKFSGISRYLRFVNLDDYMRGNIDRFDQQGGFLATVLSDPALKDAFEIIYTTLMPVVAHELAHLRSNQTNAQLPWNPAALVERLVAEYARAEESRADKEALAHVARYVAELESEYETNPGVLLNLQALIAMASYLRDVTLDDAFNDFRGVKPQDYFVHIEQKSCEEMTEDLRALQFDHPSRVAAADPYTEEMPLLTRDEYERLRQRVVTNPAMASHAHNFARAAELLDSIPPTFKEVVQTESLFESLSQFLDGLANDDPSIMAPVTAPDGVGLTSEQLLLDVRDLFDWRPAVNCGPNDCLLGLLSGDAGYVEIMGPLEDVRRVRLVVRLVRVDRPGPGDQEEINETARNLAVLMGIARNALPESAPAVARLLTEIPRCFWFSDTQSVAGRTLLFKNLNNSGFYILEITSQT